jgi:hypothetical protein
MIERKFTARMLCLALVTLASASAHGQARPPTTPPNTNLAQAAQRFDRGVQLARENDYAAALAEFEGAYALSGNAEVLFNIAAAHENLNHYVEAADALTLYRTRAPSVSLARRGAEVDAALQRIQSRIGRLVVSLDVPGLEVLIDDHPFTPEQARAGIRVSAGERRVVLRAPRHVQREARVTVAGGESRAITEPLARTQSGLMVECNVRGARIEVDGRELARTPIESALVVDEGRHTVRVSSPGYTSYETVVDAVEGGAAVRAQLAWQEDLSAGVGARLIVRTNEPGGYAMIARRRIAMDGTALVPPGVHRLRVELPGFAPQERDVTLAQGESVSVDVLLRPLASYRLAYDQHAGLMRSLWLGTGIPGLPLLLGTGPVFVYLLAQNLNAGADYDRAQSAIDACARTACTPAQFAELRMQQESARQALNGGYTWLWVTGATAIIGAGLTIAAASFFAVAPPVDRFTRTPVFRVGIAPGGIVTRAVF